MKKVAGWCVFFAFFAFFICPVTVFAERGGADLETESTAVADEVRAMQSAVPPEVAELLPEGFFSENIDEMGASVQKASAPSAILSAVGRITGLAIGENLSLFAKICGVLILSAVFRSVVKNKESAGALGQALSFCATLSLILVIFSLQRVRFSEISAYFEAMKGLSTAMLPLMGALYAMGGNVAAAIEVIRS